MLDISYAALRAAWRAFRAGKKPTRAIDEFCYNLEANLIQLTAELTDNSYRHGGYQSLIIREKKRRDLAVAGVRDRVVHRLLYDYLVDKFDATFDSDIWSCRVDKGLHRCLARTQKLLKKYPYSYVWRADVSKFFDSVNHEVLMTCLQRKIGHDKIATRLCAEVISSYAVSKQGIPIGNLTSQIFANIYLNELDRFVRHVLKPQAYIRYGDDFIMFCSVRREICRLREQTESFLQNSLHLAINQKKQCDNPRIRGFEIFGP